MDINLVTALLNSVPEVPDEAADKVRDVAGEDREGDESLEQLGALGEVDEGQVAVVREPLHEVGGIPSSFWSPTFKVIVVQAKSAGYLQN